MGYVPHNQRRADIALRIFWEIQQSGFEQKPREFWKKKKCKTPAPININESGRTSNCYSIINLLEVGNAAENSTLAAQTALTQQEIEVLFCWSECRKEKRWAPHARIVPTLIIFFLLVAKPSANKVVSKFLHKICKAPVFDPLATASREISERP